MPCTAGSQIVKASANSIADTARVLHGRGFADDLACIMVAASPTTACIMRSAAD
jgi:hypothetical protein